MSPFLLVLALSQGSVVPESPGAPVVEATQVAPPVESSGEAAAPAAEATPAAATDVSSSTAPESQGSAPVAETPTEPPPSVVAPVEQVEAAPAAPAVPAAPVAPAAPATKPHTRWGVLLDADAPNGAGAAVLFRPLPWLRVNGGVATNTLGVAARAGVGVAFYFPITPSFNLDVGHYFPADYGAGLSKRFGVSIPEGPAALMLKNFGYDFATASVGLELGSPRYFSFFVRGGLTYWSLRVNESQALLGGALGEDGLSADPVNVRFTIPTVKAGFLIYFK